RLDLLFEFWFRDAKFFHSGSQSVWVNAKERGRANWAFYSPVGFLQCSNYQLSLALIERLRCSGRHRGYRRRQWLGRLGWRIILESIQQSQLCSLRYN